MVLWFASLSVLAVFVVFRDGALDYRLVAAGSLLPDVVDLAIRRGIGPAHSVTAAVGLLMAVMLATIGRRPLRRRLLALSIGVFAHLVLDGAWANTDAFWWPLSTQTFHGAIPTVARGWGIVAAQELVGAVGALYAYRRFGLAGRARRTAFVRTGRLDDVGVRAPVRRVKGR